MERRGVRKKQESTDAHTYIFRLLIIIVGRIFSLSISLDLDLDLGSHWTGSSQSFAAFAASSSPHLTSSSSCLFHLVLLSRILCHTGVNASSVAIATPRMHVLISVPLPFDLPHLYPRALLALHDNALPMVSIPRPLPPFCVPPPFLSPTPRSYLSDRHYY